MHQLLDIILENISLVWEKVQRRRRRGLKGGGGGAGASKDEEGPAHEILRGL